MTEVEESGHHDLCFISDPPSQECICERLKQAENYARIAVMHTVDVDSYEQGQRDCKATHPALALEEITRIASKGYGAGLDAAREAVSSMVIETVGNSAATVDQAVAAIDALREGDQP